MREYHVRFCENFGLKYPDLLVERYNKLNYMKIVVLIEIEIMILDDLIKDHNVSKN